MPSDSIQCARCGLNHEIDSNLELNAETYEKFFKCICQKRPDEFHYFFKCVRHNFGKWVTSINELGRGCEGCHQESLKNSTVKIRMAPMPTSQSYHIPSPYELERRSQA